MGVAWSYWECLERFDPCHNIVIGSSCIWDKFIFLATRRPRDCLEMLLECLRNPGYRLGIVTGHKGMWTFEEEWQPIDHGDPTMKNPKRRCAVWSSVSGKSWEWHRPSLVGEEVNTLNGVPGVAIATWWINFNMVFLLLAYLVYTGAYKRKIPWCCSDESMEPMKGQPQAMARKWNLKRYRWKLESTTNGCATVTAG
eukprot:Gb_31858 [translate_table: standard]